MSNVKDLLIASRDILVTQSQAPDMSPLEKLQYKVMLSNINRMISIITQIETKNNRRKTR